MSVKRGAIFWILLSILLKASAEICSKQAGVSSLGEGFLAVAMNPWFHVALLAVMLQACTWTMALRLSPLSFAYPFTSLGIVLGVFAGVFLFQEGISVNEIFGTAIIACGVLLMTTEGQVRSS